MTYAFFRAPYEWANFDVDLERFARLLANKLEPAPHTINIKPTARDIRRLHKRALRTGEFIAYDIETAPSDPAKPWTGLDPTQAKLKVLGVGTCTEGYSIHWSGRWRKVERALQALLEDPKVFKGGHNSIGCDDPVLNRHGVRVHRGCYLDTRDARRVISSTSALSLAHLASIYTDPEPWKEGEGDDLKGAVNTKDAAELRRYNAYDCVYTARSARGIQAEPEWKSKRIQRLHEVQHELALIASEMRCNGIRINRKKRREFSAALWAKHVAKKQELVEHVGVKGFEGSPNHMRALLFKKHAAGKYKHLAKYNLPDPIDPAAYTKPKNPDAISVDEDALTLLLIDPTVPREVKQTIDLYWDTASFRKQRSTFVSSKKVLHAIGPDNRLRAGWNSCGTDTGRFACKEPNLMNIEKELRAMYEAEDGWVIVSADWSQLEIRVMAVVADDPVLTEALNVPGGVYVSDAKDFFGLPAHLQKCECKAHCERPTLHVKQDCYKQSKIIHLGTQYGAGKKTVMQQALRQDKKIQWKTVDVLHDRFRQKYERTVAYWDEEFARVVACGYSEDRLLGRRRTYPREPERPETANYPVQSTAASIKNLALIASYRRFKKEIPEARILLDLHDALYYEVPERKQAHGERILKETMEAPVKFMGDWHTFKVKVSSGKTWADC